MTQTLIQPDVSHYTYRVSWSTEDNEFVATCVEFPSLFWLAGSQDKALRALVSLVAEVVADLTADGQQAPAPLAERSFSGKLNVRLGPDLHRRVALAAAEAGVSLNTFLIQKISDRD